MSSLIHLSLSIAISFSVAYFAMSRASGTSVQDASLEQQVQLPPDTKRTSPLLDRRSSMHALLTEAFADGGWPLAEASMAATWAMKNRVQRGFDKPPPMPPGATLDPESSVHALLIEEFVKGGWDMREASLVATEKLIEYLARPRMMGECAGNSVTIVYCEGDPAQKKKFAAQMHRSCFEAIFGTSSSPDPCDFGICLGSNWKYLSLTTVSPCATELPRGCVWAYINPSGVEIDCDTAITCACFVETNPIDCGAIEHQCCAPWPETCSGCPSCGG